MPSSAKFRENLNLQQFKVNQGQWFWYQSKAHMRLPISRQSTYLLAENCVFFIPLFDSAPSLPMSAKAVAIGYWRLEFMDPDCGTQAMYDNLRFASINNFCGGSITSIIEWDIAWRSWLLWDCLYGLLPRSLIGSVTISYLTFIRTSKPCRRQIDRLLFAFMLGDLRQFPACPSDVCSRSSPAMLLLLAKIHYTRFRVTSP